MLARLRLDFYFEYVRYKEFLIIIIFFALSVGACWVIQYIEYRPAFKIGINACSGAEYLQIALEQKYFEKAGLRVRFVEFGSLQDVQQAFEWQQIDAMICPFVDAMVMQCKSNNYDSKIILFTSFARRQFSWNLMTWSTIKSIKELKGKRIGVEINSFSNYVLCRALKTEGLTLQDIEVVPVDPTAHLTFLQNEKVDGVVTYWPFNSDLQVLGNDLHSIYSTEEWPREMKLNVLLIQQSKLKIFHRNLSRFVGKWDEVLSVYKREYSYYHSSVSFMNLPDYYATLKTIHPLPLSEQISLICNNRYILDLMENVKTEMLVHNHLDYNRSLESIFDSSVIRNSLKQ